MDDTLVAAVAARVDSSARAIDIILAGGQVYCCSLADASERLSLVEPSLLDDWEWIGPHVGIHWPTVDEDLSIEHLIAYGQRCDKDVPVAEPRAGEMRDIIRDIHALAEELAAYERRYGILSETFYDAYRRIEEPAAEHVPLDWSEWAGVYETLRRRRGEYQAIVEDLRQGSGDLFGLVELTRR